MSAELDQAKAEAKALGIKGWQFMKLETLQQRIAEKQTDNAAQAIKEQREAEKAPSPPVVREEKQVLAHPPKEKPKGVGDVRVKASRDGFNLWIWSEDIEKYRQLGWVIYGPETNPQPI